MTAETLKPGKPGLVKCCFASQVKTSEIYALLVQFAYSGPKYQFKLG